MSAARRLLPAPVLADRGVVALVSLLTLVVVVGAAVAGSWLRTTADEMAADAFGEAPYSARQVHVLYAEVRDGGVPDGAAATLHDSLAPELRTLLHRPRHAVVTTEAMMEALPKQPQYSPSYLSVAALPGAEALVDVVAGRRPRPGTTEVVLPASLAATYDGPRRVPVVEVLLERSAAEAMDVGVGTYLDLVPRRYSRDAPDRIAVPRVSGLFEATAPAPSALDDVDNLRRPAISELPELSVVRATALAADERTVLEAPWATEPEVRWTFDPRGVPTADQAEAALDEARLLAVQPWPPVLDSAASTAVTGIGDLAATFLERRQAADGVAAVVLAATAAAALALLLAAAAVLEARRRDVSTVLRARGAGTVRLLLLRGGEAALLVLPGLVVVAVLVAARVVAAADAVPALGAALASAVLLTAVQVSPWQGVPERFRDPVRDATQVVTALLAAAITTVLVGRDGIAATDPLLLVLPALVGATGAVLVVRGMRLVAVVTRGAAARGRRLTALVGTSQAAEVARHLTLPVAAVVLGLGSAILAGAVGDTVQRGADRAAWATLGADVRVSQALLGEADLERLRRVPGVEAVAPVYAVEALLDTATGRKPVRVLAVDPDAMTEVTARGPQEIRLPDSSGDAMPALVSPDLELDDDVSLAYAQAEVPVRVAGRPDRVPGVTEGESFVVVDVATFRAATDRVLLRAETVLVAGDPDPDALTQVVRRAWPTAAVDTREAIAAAVLDGPVASRTLGITRVVVVASAVVAVLAAGLAVALGGPVRRRTRAVLRALGADGRQARRVGALQVVPTVAAAALAAVATALVLMAVAGEGVALTALTGGEPGTTLAPDVSSWLVAAGLGVVGLALLAFAAAAGRTPDDPGTIDEGGTR